MGPHPTTLAVIIAAMLVFWAIAFGGMRLRLTSRILCAWGRKICRRVSVCSIVAVLGFGAIGEIDSGGDGNAILIIACVVTVPLALYLSFMVRWRKQLPYAMKIAARVAQIEEANRENERFESFRKFILTQVEGGKLAFYPPGMLPTDPSVAYFAINNPTE